MLMSDDDTTQWIGLPGGLSISGIAYIWNRWRPWREKFSRHPMLCSPQVSPPSQRREAGGRRAHGRHGAVLPLDHTAQPAG